MGAWSASGKLFGVSRRKSQDSWRQVVADEPALRVAKRSGAAA